MEEKIKEVKELLKSVDREGMGDLIKYMERKGYFISPASTVYHGNYEGGLIEHCLSVYKLFNEYINKFNLTLSKDSIIICTFCHDLCKAGMYNKANNVYKFNPFNGKGHAKLSLERIERFIKLTEEEKLIIKYHMGMYGTTEFNARGEYTLKELVDAFNFNNLAKLFYFCDDMSSQFLEHRK